MNIDEVKLIPLPNGAPSPWRVTYNGKSGDKPGDYPVVGLMKDSGPHMIHFELSGNHSGITFADNPIWVNAGSKPNPGAADGQIVALASNDGKELFVLDMNTNKQPVQLHYSMNFVGHPALDPIIDNGGHGFYLGTAHLLIGAAIVLVVGFFIRPLYRAMFSR